MRLGGMLLLHSMCVRRGVVPGAQVMCDGPLGGSTIKSQQILWCDVLQKERLVVGGEDLQVQGASL